MTRLPRPLCITTALLLAATGVACGDEPARPPADPVDTGLAGTLTTQNSVGRAGAFYLPPHYDEGPRPLMLLYHGTGGNGASMVTAFRPLAEARGIILVAPDSRVAPNGDFSWEVGSTPGSRTEDYLHSFSCLNEVLALPGVSTDPVHWMAAGFSGGGSSAPYFATNDARFEAFAVLHGGVFADNLGENVARGWFSTGESDGLRPPDLVAEHVEAARARGFTDLTNRVYPGGHILSAQEKEDLLEWWLGAE